MIIILFGLSGSGKTYIGNLLASEFGFHHIDGDQFLTLKMKEFIKNNKSFSQEMVDEFTIDLINEIDSSRIKHPNLVISQGLYRSKNRLQILNAFKEKTRIIFIQVNSSNAYQRVINRNNQVSIELAEKISANFEEMPEAFQINNNSENDLALIKQLKTILATS